jgi:hypothetical protein
VSKDIAGIHKGGSGMTPEQYNVEFGYTGVKGLSLEESQLLSYYSQLPIELKLKVWNVFKEAQLIAALATNDTKQ